MPQTKYSKNIQTVIEILQDEVRGNTKDALRKMTKNYTMTWVYETSKGTLFPHAKLTKGDNLNDAYSIQGRQYEIMHLAENKNTVMVELIESYPDPDTKKVYRTPLVLVLEMKNGKIETGRHYCDPRLSYQYLTPGQASKAFAKKISPSLVSNSSPKLCVQRVCSLPYRVYRKLALRAANARYLRNVSGLSNYHKAWRRERLAPTRTTEKRRTHYWQK